MTDRESYDRGCNILLALVRDWTGEQPRFVFGPEGVAIIGDVRDFGPEKLTRNDGARELLALAINRCVERTGNAPTVLMLEVVLKVAGVPFERGSLEELGLGAVAAAVKAKRPH